jgi:TPR repeat protein
VVGLAPLAWADDATAIRSLAEQGDAKAQFALGTMYHYGQGVAQDHAEALRWWREAAEQGVIDAAGLYVVQHRDAANGRRMAACDSRK